MKPLVGGLVTVLMVFFAMFASSALGQPRTSDVIAKPPSEMAPPPGIVGPTDNITKVAQAMSTRAKSLTTLVVIAPGVQVTQPVTVSIGYYSSAGSNRITQSYVTSTGNHFLYNDLEGDGKPRQMNIHVTFEEPRPGGGVYTFSWLMSLMLDPLYDVAIGPLDFTLFTDCDLVGDSEIHVQWRPPESDEPRESAFDTSAGEHVTVGEFAWSRQEVSASDNLHLPVVAFVEEDLLPWPIRYKPGVPPGGPPLVPGTTHQVVQSLDEAGGQCRASVQYDITYTLRFYPFL